MQIKLSKQTIALLKVISIIFDVLFHLIGFIISILILTDVLELRLK